MIAAERAVKLASALRARGFEARTTPTHGVLASKGGALVGAVVQHDVGWSTSIGCQEELERAVREARAEGVR